MKAVISVLIAAACLLVAPGVVSAATYEVNSTGDAPDNGAPNGICETATPGECTLRAAITESNSSAGLKDAITFSAAFNGQLADTIGTGAGFPAITEPVTIDGDGAGQCATATTGSIPGPCVGVEGASGLAVDSAAGTVIEGLSITNAGTAINVIDDSGNFIARNNWIGVKLDGNAGSNTAGIFIDPGSNNGQIGGTAAAARNVFANTTGDALQILGADETWVAGNYFGVGPDGITAAVNGENIEIGSQLAGGFLAEKNLIGVKGPFAGAPTPQCDNGCNVIAGASLSGIDLHGDPVQGESPAAETHVAGNFIGLAANGTTVVPNAPTGFLGAAGVKVGAAAKTVIGGTEDEGNEANFFAGGIFAIYQENSNALQVLGNEIGFNPSGAHVASPEVGMIIICNTTTEAATIEDNAIRMDAGGLAIEHGFLGATITGNFIEGGQTGILSKGTGSPGNLIAENVFEEVGGNAILIKSDLNLVVDNEILGSGGAGIRIQDTGPPFASPTTENQIGGDTEASENTISGSGGDAVEIVDFEGTQNEVARNNGTGNGGLFIDLAATNPGTEPLGPNGGVKPPVISTASQTEASGTAEPEATVRVFRKASAEAGEIQSFLEEAVADDSGEWKVTYPSIPGDTIVAATQTNVEGGTSELETAKVPPPESTIVCSVTPADPTCLVPERPELPPVAPCPPMIGGDCGPPMSPETTITKGPKAQSTKTTAKFKFKSSVGGSTFECRLDKKQFKSCKSPKTYKKLKPGKHVFKVRAVGPTGLVDSTPAKRKFTVLDSSS
ncbi:MAG TPA: right-handed parallel beta-helix repeat-containing protein [Solirubrobacterales bacterium]|nr:right-handed parallel beta-helix repeat-containing protein [Solirubrobacterales bacterium]